MGIFTAKAAKNASHSHRCHDASNPASISVGISVVPAFRYIARMASSMSTDPSSV